MSIRVSIIDNHPLLIRGMVSLLQQHPDMEVSGTYFDRNHLIKGVEEERPDVLLLDVHMRELKAIELVQYLKKKYPGLRLIAFTNMDHEYYIHAMLESGVNGYLLRNSDESSLIAAIQSVYGGEQFFGKGVYELVLKIQHKQKRRGRLTQREQEVLGLIAEGNSSADIAELLSLSRRTIENHRYNLLLKLDAVNSAGLIRKAITLGLL